MLSPTYRRYDATTTVSLCATFICRGLMQVLSVCKRNSIFFYILAFAFCSYIYYARETISLNCNFFVHFPTVSTGMQEKLICSTRTFVFYIFLLFLHIYKRKSLAGLYEFFSIAIFFLHFHIISMHM